MRDRIKSDIRAKRVEFLLIAFHVVLGVGVFSSSIFAKLYNICSVLYFLRLIYVTKNKNNEVLIASAYMIGSDVLFRMSGGFFLYEQVKYLLIVFFSMGIFFKNLNKKSLIYFGYLMLLVPGIFVASAKLGFDVNIRKAIAFNLSGPFTLGFAALYCYDLPVTYKQLKKILLYALFPIISIGVYLFLYTPDVQASITSTGSNFATSGGFGPNQVSTMLGLGMFVVATRFFLEAKTITWKVIYGALFFGLTFRGLITLSRGGILTAFLMMVSFFFFLSFYTNKKVRLHTQKTLIIFLVGVFGVFVYSNIQSNGMLGNRYANEDALGREKEDVTTGRGELFAMEFQAFEENPFEGIGVGNVRFYREDLTGETAASHNEISRLLAEHGFLGILILIILIMTPLIRFVRNHRNIFAISFYIFWFLTINHAAMRIAAPAFLYGLSLITLYNEKPTVHRKQTVA